MELTELPNIGPVLAENLRRAGIETPEELRGIGEYEAFLRVRARVGGGACLHQLEAIAGAAAGVKKSALPPEKKAELKAWFRTIKNT